MILLCAEGFPSKEVAARLGVHRSTADLEADRVQVWREAPRQQHEFTVAAFATDPRLAN